MYTTSRLLTLLHQHLGARVGPLVWLLALAIAVVLGMVGIVVAELWAASADPVQVAPLRWNASRM